MELLGPIIAALLTVMVFSYIFGDNVLFKLAAHIFVGVAVGYAIIILGYEVLAPALTLDNMGLVRVFPALLLCLLLVFKIRPQQDEFTNVLGSIAMAFVLGVGAALAVGGALFGTLTPQVGALSALSLYPDTSVENGWVVWLNNIVMMLCTLSTLAYFTFVVRSRGPLSGLHEMLVRFGVGMGRVAIIITLAALFANTFTARVAVLISRLQFLTGLFQ